MNKYSIIFCMIIIQSFAMQQNEDSTKGLAILFYKSSDLHRKAIKFVNNFNSSKNILMRTGRFNEINQLFIPIKCAIDYTIYINDDLAHKVSQEIINSETVKMNQYFDELNTLFDKMQTQYDDLMRAQSTNICNIL